MAFKLSGQVAQGAQDELQEMLAQALQEEQLRTSAQLQQQRIDQDSRQFDASQALDREQLGFQRERAKTEDTRNWEETEDRSIRDMRSFQREFDEKMSSRQERMDDADTRAAERAADRAARVEDRDSAAGLARELARMRPGREPDYQWVRMPDGSVREVVVGRSPAGAVPLERGSSGSDKTTGPMEDTAQFMRGMKGLSDAMHTEASGLRARGQGLVDQGQAMFGYDDDTREYQRRLETFTPMLARLVGHVGVLTQLDVESAQKMLPPVGATKSEAARAWGEVDRFLKSKGVNLGLGMAPPGDLRADPNAPKVDAAMPPGAVVIMRAPNGQTKDVPASEVQLYLSKGATIVGRR